MIKKLRNFVNYFKKNKLIGESYATKTVFKNKDIKENKFKYLLASCNQGQKKAGVNFGPETIAHFLDNYTIFPNYNFNNSEGYKKLKNEVSTQIKDKMLPITIGGDHSISIGTVSGSLDQESDLTVIWIDAHPDLNTKKSSESGNLHGMPLSFLTNIEKDNYDFQENFLKPKNIIYLGIRDIDDFEQETIEKYNIQYLTSKDISSNINDLKKIKIDTKKIHLSVDVDVLDKKYMPCTGTIVKDGITIRQLEQLIKWASEQGDIISADLVEFNPYIGNSDEVSVSLDNLYKIIFYLQKYLR